MEVAGANRSTLRSNATEDGRWRLQFRCRGSRRESAVAQLSTLDHMNLNFYLIVFVFPMLATIPVTALLCRYRTAHKKPVSYGTTFAGACIIPLLLFLFFTAAILLSSNDGKAPTPLLFLQLFGFVACVCVLPALGVVMYYQRRSKRDEKPVV